MNEEVTQNQPCYFFEFGLLVTGKTEEQHLPELFKNLSSTGICSFKVWQWIPQLSPRTSPKRELKIVGSNKKIPNEDVQKIGLPARDFLTNHPCRYILLIDDLEKDRVNIVEQVFQRYRDALDAVLKDEQKFRASVHFLANMLEAYYFADAQAINQVLGTTLEDYSGDVETIHHPKGKLKEVCRETLNRGFDEKDDGGKILQHLRVEYVLSNPQTCAYLRTMFYWCYKVLQKYPQPEVLEQFPFAQYHFGDGIFSPVTKQQLEDV